MEKFELYFDYSFTRGLVHNIRALEGRGREFPQPGLHPLAFREPLGDGSLAQGFWLSNAPTMEHTDHQGAAPALSICPWWSVHIIATGHSAIWLIYILAFII